MKHEKWEKQDTKSQEKKKQAKIWVSNALANKSKQMPHAMWKRTRKRKRIEKNSNSTDTKLLAVVTPAQSYGPFHDAILESD